MSVLFLKLLKAHMEKQVITSTLTLCKSFFELRRCAATQFLERAIKRGKRIETTFVCNAGNGYVIFSRIGKEPF
jgi:hypothetical protein